MKDLELILKNIKKKELLPIYFLHGEEPYFIDVALRSFENDILSEDERAFGQTVLYGKDTNIGEIVALAQQFPMFGERNLVIIKEAQDLKWGEEEVRILEHYISAPVATTVLVFGHKYKKVDSRKKFAKNLQSQGMLFLSEPLKDSKLPQWIADLCRSLKIPTAPNISALLAEYLGNDLSRIFNELSKIKMLLKEGEVLDEQIVETHIGISKEYNVFELQKALGTKNAVAAFKIAFYMGKNPKSNPIVMVFGNLYTFFSNIILYHTMRGEPQNAISAVLGTPPYYLKDYAEASQRYPLKHATRVISILREMDMKSKGLGANQTDDAELLKEMVFKILNVHQLKVKT